MLNQLYRYTVTLGRNSTGSIVEIVENSYLPVGEYAAVLMEQFPGWRFSIQQGRYENI